MTGDESESVLVKLTRMEGKLDLSNLRHDQTDAWKVTVDQRLHRHSNDISNLQAAEHLRTGERKGLVAGGRMLWAGIGVIPGGMIVAVVTRLLGH